MFDHVLESSHRDDSHKLSNIGFSDEITQIELIEVNFTKRIWYSLYIIFLLLERCEFQEGWNQTFIEEYALEVAEDPPLPGRPHGYEVTYSK